MPEMPVSPKPTYLARVIEKITSGRWILAWFAGVGFLTLVYQQQMDPAISMTFIMLVANWYFQRPDRVPPNP